MRKLVTPRGRTVATLAFGFLLVGRLLALRELFMVSAALLIVLGVAIVSVQMRRDSLRVRRTAGPLRTRPGSEVRVELNVANRGRFRGGPVLFEDALPPRLGVQARLSLPVLNVGDERKLAYILRPTLRGRYTIGPLEVAHTDPFGISQRRDASGGTATLVVYPAYEPVRTLPQDAQRAGAIRRSPLLGQGDEFFALRPYRDGDDLKKVHWPSSLRTGEVVVRQDELTFDPGVWIVLDTCAAKHRGEGADASVEAAISACASVATLALGAGLPVHVLTPDGPLLGRRRPSADELLEALAVLEPSPRTDMTPALGAPRAGGIGGASLVVVTPRLDRAEIARVRALASGAAGGACVHVEASTFGGGPRGLDDRRAAASLADLGLPVLRLTSGTSFAELWETGVRGVAVAR